MTTAKMTSVTVLGLGAMGSALAASLLKHGYAATLWNRSANKAKFLTNQGARFVADISEGVAASPVSILCLSDHAATMSVLNTAAMAAAAGRTIVQLSTITSAESRELAGRLKDANAFYLDGQILAYPEDVLEGRANLVFSGPRNIFDLHVSMLKAMAGNVIHVGDSHGAAPSFAKAHDSYSLGNYLAFVQGAAMCARSNVNLRAWCDYNLRYINNGAFSRELAILSNQVCTRSYDEGLGASMDVWKGAADKIVEECRSTGAGLAHLSSLVLLLNSAIAAGAGSKELGALFEHLIRPE